MRIIVTGGRTFQNVALLWRTLDLIHAEPDGISLLIEGASYDVTGPYVGADYWAMQWAYAHDVDHRAFHADWKRLGRSAGPARNGLMTKDGEPDLVVAFPGGHGTADMVRQARKAWVEVREIENGV